MKKFKSFALAAIGLLSSGGVYAHDFEVDGIYYNITSEKMVAVTYQGVSSSSYDNEYSGSVVIPEAVIYSGNTYSVTSIAREAFYECSSLTSVVIPNSVTSIGSYAFQYCSGLTFIEVGDSVSNFGSYVFNKTAWYNNQPNGVVYLGNYLLGYKGNMPTRTSIKIKDGTLLIAEAAFHYCNDLISVEIPNSVVNIGPWAFGSCSSLTSVVIPNSVTYIGSCAFYGCSSLASVTIGNNVNSLGGEVFYETAWYNNQPNGVVYFENYLLGYKGTMSTNTFIDIKDGTVLIASRAFYNCSGLTSIVIPQSVASIGDETFAHCSSLLSIEIPNNVTSIGYRVFNYCSNLLSIEIPNNVISIGDYAFEGCSSLPSIEIPNSVNSIGDRAFYGCNNLYSITSLSPTPPTTSYYSPFSNNDVTLYVPYGAKSVYSEAEWWKDIKNIVELAAPNYELTDGEEYKEASDKRVDALTYTRTLPNLYWNALYVPFELPYDVVADCYEVAYINDVNGYDTDDNGAIDDLAMEIIKIKGGTLKANYPYLIKAKTETDKAMSITVEDATLYAAEENSVDCSSVYQNYTVTGIYTKKTANELAGKLAISTSGAWQPLAVGTTLNPFRLYLSIANRDNSPLKVEATAMSRMRIVERGETTGVETITPAQQREDVIIDLSGRRVKQPVKGGVYIVNGKKQIF